MSFLERQQSAQRRTRFYILQFLLLLVPGVIGTYIACLFSVSLFANSALLNIASWYTGTKDPFGEYFGYFYLVSTLVYTPVVLWTLIWRRGRELRKTDGLVAQEIGARRVPYNAQLPDERQLSNIVEEMAIAAGIAAPEVYIWESDSGINSLTIGQSEADAAIFISRGAVQSLSRDEMQALVGHGMSQILNGDMALNTRMATYIYAFRFAPRVTMFFLAMASQERRPGKKFRAFVAWLVLYLWVGLVLAVVTFPQYLAAKLLQFGISRERQKLADASALQFTRNPDAVKAVFAKAICLGTTASTPARVLEDLAHGCFAAPLPQSGFWRTHPPLTKRLLTLDPQFPMSRIDEYREDALARARSNENASRPKPPPDRQQTAAARMSKLAAVIPALLVRAQPSQRVEQRDDRFPPLEAVNDARTELIGVLLDVRPEARPRQLAVVRESFGEKSFIALAAHVRGNSHAGQAERNAAVNALLPRLRDLPQAELERLKSVVVAMEKADPSVTVFEYALSRRVAVFIADILHPRAPHGRRKLADQGADLRVLLSAMAHHSAPRDAPMAYEAGARQLGVHLPGHYTLLYDWIAQLDAALTNLEQLEPIAKELLVEALRRIASYDRGVGAAEEELVRSIASSLHCPVPR